MSSEAVAPAGFAAREPGALAGAGEIPLCVPVMHPAAWEYVRDCLDTGWVSSVGSYVTRFEQLIGEAVGGVTAVATVSGTAALHVALQAVGVGRDDEVVVPTLTFVAPANAVRYLGAVPVFVDAEPDYWQIDPAAIERFLRERCGRDGGGVLRNRATGRRVAALLPVHILGHPVDLDPILALAAEFGLPVVEDATEGLGARYRGRALGSLGTVAAFSFNGNKLLTTGGGGMLVSPDPALARRARHLTTQAKADPIEFVHDDVGYNYRLSNVLAAIGCSQAERLDEHLAAKRRIAARYAAELADVPGLTPMPEAPWAESAFWLYTVLVDETRYGRSSRELLRALAAEGVQARPLWQPMHRSPAHAASERASCPVADRLVRDALSLPCSVNLTEAEQATVIRLLRRLGGATH